MYVCMYVFYPLVLLGNHKKGQQARWVPAYIGMSNRFFTPPQIVCGLYHCLALSTSGVVVSWGRGKHGQLGHGHRIDRCEPRIITSLREVENKECVCLLLLLL